MPRRYIDLSVALKSGIKSDPPGSEPKITYPGLFTRADGHGANR